MMPPPNFWLEEGAERPAKEVGHQSPAHDLLGLIKSGILRLQGTDSLCDMTAATNHHVIWQEHRRRLDRRHAGEQQPQVTAMRCSKNFVLAQSKQMTSWHAG